MNKNIKKFIAAGQLKEALESLNADIHSCNIGKSYEHEIFILLDRFSTNNRGNHQGVISKSEYDIERNRLTAATLDLLERSEKEEKDTKNIIKAKNAQPKSPRTENDIVERETYYVILLLDSSQSMVWPYLQDQSNTNQLDSEDYKNAITEIQNEMQSAHEKSLNSLRGSSPCKDGYMKVFQYTFNHRKKSLNGPEELNTFGLDKVVKIGKNNYTPEGKTALYDVIDESLKVAYDLYLKKTMEEEKRIDKLIIGVVTDGEDTVLNSEQKDQKINEIKRYLKMLRGDGDIKKCFLVSSVLIGLTGSDFSETRLKEIKKELSFDESISINQADEQSIRKAFNLFSTNALNI